MKKNYTVPEGITERLDVWLAGETGLTRSQIQKLIKLNQVLVNDVLPKKNGDRLETGDAITITEKGFAGNVEKKKKNIRDASFEIPIVSETSEYIIINKPAGLIVHPDRTVNDTESARASNTLTGWILRNYPELAGVGEHPNRPGMVHRLDKDTSGLMVIAKTADMFAYLKDEFKNRRVVKKYYALAHGSLPTDHGFINFLVARGPTGRMVARPNITEITLKNVDSIQDGRVALTEFNLTKKYINYSYCDITLHTGRTHQIRVHFFAYNHPLVGDPLYFNKKTNNNLDKKLGRVFLHSYFLAFNDRAGELREFQIPLPKELENVLSALKPV